MSLAVSAFSFLLAWVGKIYCWQESVNDIKLHLYSIFNLSDFINIIRIRIQWARWTMGRWGREILPVSDE